VSSANTESGWCLVEYQISNSSVRWVRQWVFQNKEDRLMFGKF